MANATTNVTTPGRSIAMDLRLMGRLWKFIGAGNEEVRRYMWMGVFLILGGYAAACFFHYQGMLYINLLLSVVAATTLFVYGFQPLTIGAAILGGLGYAAAEDEVLWPEGMKAAVEALGRLVAAAIFFSAGTFGFYGTYPFDLMGGAGGYLALLVAAIVGVSLIVYRKIETGSWLQTITGLYIAVVVIGVLLGGIPLVRDTATLIADTAAKVAGYEPAPTPLSEEEQADKLKADAQRLEIEAQERRIAAKTEDLAAKEAAARAAVEASLPKTVQVAACKEDPTDEKGWSKPVPIPAEWGVKAEWGGKAMRTQMLKDGIWQKQVKGKEAGMVAVRYCTTSEANLGLREGKMTLTWSYRGPM